MKIGVIGGGVVGSATAAAWRGHCDEVRVYDVDPARRTHDFFDFFPWNPDVIFVCLPEAAVEGFFMVLAGNNLLRNYVLKSTVPVGTTRWLAERYGLPNLVHSPEFLTARTAEHDAANPRLNVIGYTVANNRRSGGQLLELYVSRWPNVPRVVMPSDASELMKLALNTFFATKVSYWNEVESYCRATGIDYETVRAACVAEGRVGDLHTHVPGPDSFRGFGGTCLPKDLRQLMRCFTDAGVACPVMTAVHARNKYHDRPEGK